MCFLISIFGISKIPTYGLKEALVSASGLLMAGIVKIVHKCSESFYF